MMISEARVLLSQLARRVRSMRETRTAPVAQKFEHKATAPVGRVLTTLQSFPRGMECVDPLGRGIIDNKTLRLITESSETTNSEKEPIDSNLREKLMYFSEKFDAKLFLSRIHQDTPAAALEAGALALKTDLQGRTQQRKQLVKDNFDCFISCKTTIDDIESKLKRIEEDPEGSGTAHLYNCMQGVCSQAERAFEPLFERQAQAEKIRSVQGMLQRFRTLFNLPSTIRGNISKGEYDLAVREYKKAKSIALPSHVSKYTKKVLEEVERVMQEFKGTLYKSMEDPQIDLTGLENTVRLLLELEPESDPVWHYLNVQNHRIRGLLQKCTSDHDARMETLHNELREKAISDAKWLQIQQSSSDDNYSFGSVELPMELQPLALTGEEVDSSQVSDSPGSKSEEKVGDGRYSSHSLDEVAGMVRGTISVYETKVLNAFRDLEESSLQSYMSDAIKEISKACLAFEAKEAAPPIVVMALRTLQAEVTKIYILRLCSWMRTTTEGITKEETWVPVSILERNKSPSYLPLAFRTVMASAFDEIQESVKIAFLNCFLDFVGHLERIAQNKSSKESLHLQNGEEELSSDLPGSIVDPHQRLLIVLSNIGYCKDELSSELYNKYKCIWLHPRDKDEGKTDIKELAVSFLGLEEKRREEKRREEKVLEQYTFAKANLIRTAATNYLLDSGVQWGSVKTILNPFFTSDARESMKSLQGVLEDAVPDERQQGASVSPEWMT
ncbi:hypothetical protein GQ457_02G025680 [Hibiscus cannabinus]